MIDTVLFDMGGTLEDVEYSRDIRLEGVKQVLGCLKDNGIDITLPDIQFLDVLEKRNSEYKAWCEKTMIESPPEEIWHKWHLKDFDIPEENISSLSEYLAALWETRFFRRELRENVPHMLEVLKSRGYKLGIISNTSSRGQVINSLREYGIDGYFDYICLSSIEGIRKPSAEIFLKAAREMGSSPDRSAYVGDTVSRDVIGSKDAGYALAIQIGSFLTKTADSIVDKSYKPDYLINNMAEIPEILEKANCRQ